MTVALMAAEGRGQGRPQRAGVGCSVLVFGSASSSCYDLLTGGGSGRLFSVPTILGYQFYSVGHSPMTYLIFIFKAFHEEGKYSRKGNVVI